MQAQTIQEADVEINFKMYDNAGTQYNSQVLTFGLDTTATNGIDTHLGESDLPCVYHFFTQTKCPPVDIFRAVLILPENGFNGSLISFKDIRNGELPFTGIKEHRIAYQAQSTATGVFLDYDLPDGVIVQLQDIIIGTLINVYLSDSGTYAIPPQYINVLNKLVMNVYYDNVTPVELTSFTAYVSDNSVNLNWQTATETNNSGFQIERRKTLDERSEEWNTISFVSGNGTTIEPHTYAFVDKNLSSGIYKYRLKQIDYDGTSNYSNEIEVDITPNEFALYQNYPNPFNPITIIQFSIGTKQFVQLKVYDVLGNEIATLVNEEKAAGIYNVQFVMDNFSSGIYFYKLTAGEFVQTKKMLLLK